MHLIRNLYRLYIVIGHLVWVVSFGAGGDLFAEASPRKPKILETCRHLEL